MRLPVTTAQSGGGEGGTSQADAQHERAAEAARERDEGRAADLSMPAGVNGASSRQLSAKSERMSSWRSLGYLWTIWATEKQEVARPTCGVEAGGWRLAAGAVVAPLLVVAVRCGCVCVCV